MIRQLSSDGYWEGNSSSDAPPPIPCIQLDGGRWPCKSGPEPHIKHDLRPDPEALRHLQEAWRHAVQ